MHQSFRGSSGGLRGAQVYVLRRQTIVEGHDYCMHLLKVMFEAETSISFRA